MHSSSKSSPLRDRKAESVKHIQNRKQAQKLVKRYTHILKGYEKNLVTRPVSAALRIQSCKNMGPEWRPVLLMDKQQRAKDREEIQRLLSPLTGTTSPKGKHTAKHGNILQKNDIFVKKNWNQDKARGLVTSGPNVIPQDIKKVAFIVTAVFCKFNQ